MEREKRNRPVIAIAVVTVSLAASACRVNVGKDAGNMDERGATVWIVDGKNIQIDRSYFQAQTEKNLMFVVEWTCSDCRFQRAMSQEEALVASRPVLWYAVESGEATRTAVTKLGSGRMQTNRLVSVIAYQIDGKPQQTTVSVDNLDPLFDWTWVLGDHSYRVFAPGYYFDQDARRLYFTVKWHDSKLCDELPGITDERAANLAMPILKQIVSRKLFQFVPRVGAPPEVAVHEVDAVGVEIGCPEPTCAGAVNCPATGYRVSRTLAEIARSP